MEWYLILMEHSWNCAEWSRAVSWKNTRLQFYWSASLLFLGWFLRSPQVPPTCFTLRSSPGSHSWASILPRTDCVPTFTPHHSAYTTATSTSQTREENSEFSLGYSAVSLQIQSWTNDILVMKNKWRKKLKLCFVFLMKPPGNPSFAACRDCYIRLMFQCSGKVFSPSWFDWFAQISHWHVLDHYAHFNER